MINFKKIYTDTFKPELPKLINGNFSIFSDYLNVFYDPCVGNLGTIDSSINTNKTVKATTGDFSDSSILGVFQNKQNFRTKLNTYIKGIFNLDASLPSQFADTVNSTLNYSVGNTTSKTIDILKPQYKLVNDTSLYILNAQHTGQIVQLLFDTSSNTLGGNFSVELESANNNIKTINISGNDSSVACLNLICTSDTSTSSTWDFFKGNGNFNIINRSTLANINYGYLYNLYVVRNTDVTSNDEWRSALNEDWSTLLSFVSGQGYQTGEALRSTTGWPDGTISYDAYGFNAKGSGSRDVNGDFQNVNSGYTIWWGSDFGNNYFGYYKSMAYFEANITGSATYYWLGLSIRLVKQSLTDVTGQTGTYTGNDGKVYKTVGIGNQWWLASNLAETKYRNGDVIPTITGAFNWVSTGSGAKCAYDNNASNV